MAFLLDSFIFLGMGNVLFCKIAAQTGGVGAVYCCNYGGCPAIDRTKPSLPARSVVRARVIHPGVIKIELLLLLQFLNEAHQKRRTRDTPYPCIIR